MDDLQRFEPQPIQSEVIQYDSMPEEQGDSTADLIMPLLRRWPIILVTAIIISAMGMPAVWFLMKPKFTTTGAIRISPIKERIIFSDADSERPMPNYDNFKNTEAESFKSDEILNKVADKLNNENITILGLEGDLLPKLRNALEESVISIVPARRSELIVLQMTAGDSVQSQKIINAFIDVYIGKVKDDERKTGGETTKLLIEQKDAYEQQIEQQQELIRQLTVEYGTQELDPRQEMMLQEVARLQSELVNINIKRISLEAQIAMIEEGPEDQVDQSLLLERQNAVVDTDPNIQTLTADIRRYQQALMEAEQKYNDKHPELLRIKKMLSTYRDQLASERKALLEEVKEKLEMQQKSENKRKLADLQSQLNQAVMFEEKIREKLQNQDADTRDIGRKQFMIDDEKEKLARTKELYNQVSQRLEELRVEGQRPGRIEIARYASSVPAHDKKKQLLMATPFGGVGLGIAIAFLLAKLDNSLSRPEDIVRRVGVRIIGTTTNPKHVDRKVLAQQLADDYQTIRANLGLLDEDRTKKIIAVTSPSMGDGKTTFAINLATSFAQTGQRVLIIDGDLRKPDVAYSLNLPKGLRGLQDLLFGKSLEESLYRMNSNGLYILAADERNASDALDLIGRPQVSEMIRKISEQFDHVIIDTPPVLAFSDALLWSKMADSAILTSFVGHTSQPDLREAITRLEQIGVKVMGTVVNNVNISQSYHRYGYGYGYGYSSGGSKSRRQQSRKRHPRQNLLLSSE